MPRNGLGTYSLPAGQPVVSGATISASTFNTLTNDLASALTQSLCIDGQAVPTANLNMGGFKLTNAALGTATTDMATLQNFASPPAIGATTPAAISGAGNINLNKPATLWATATGVVSPTSDGVGGYIYHAGSFRASWSCNGYRNTSNQWTSLSLNGSTGAALIQMDPTGLIVFSADSSKASGSSSSPTERARITSNGLQIGTTTESADLGIYSSTGPLVRVTGDDATYIQTRTYSNTTSAAPWFYCVKGGGTLASPNALGVNDSLGGMRFFGRYNASSETETARIQVIAEAAWTSTTNARSFMAFYTNPSGTGLQESMRLTSAGNLGIGLTPTYQLQLSTDSAAKPSTSTWTIASDARIKTVTGEYRKGLKEICALRPVTYEYNGLGGFKADGKENVSIVAQEAMAHFPECVGTFEAKLQDGDEEPTQLYNWNGHAVMFALINAIKEQQAAIVALEARLAALEPA